MQYVSNAFSLQMVPRALLHTVRIEPCERPDTSGLQSIVGHADTAAILDVPFNRASVTLKAGDVLYVAQLVGGRLPEGTTTLPEGFRLEWIRVEVAGVIASAEALLRSL